MGLFTYIFLSASIAFGIYWGTHTEEVNKKLAFLLTTGGLIISGLVVIGILLLLALWGISSIPESVKEIAAPIIFVIFVIVVKLLMEKFANSKKGSSVVNFFDKPLKIVSIGIILLFVVGLIVLLVSNWINYGRLQY